MRSVSGDSGTVLPWHVIRQDGNGNSYRVGTYATRSEAQQVAERLGKNGDGGADSYLVERMDRGSGGRG
ncbi:SPOR domain-containing protein [Streptomyces daliensis]|uniref:SPOR domain-containing protein n=1 Tax=Streptomyces daliensis TaxID=299421 RepID=A0A8T4IN54_9ACTN|nr:SPOR domain-containing protein [Streptomyces daliensis]